MTVATLSRAFKEVIIKVLYCDIPIMHTFCITNNLKYLSETADNLDGLPLKLHDFGCRGCSSLEVNERSCCIDTVIVDVYSRLHLGVLPILLTLKEQPQ